MIYGRSRVAPEKVDPQSTLTCLFLLGNCGGCMKTHIYALLDESRKIRYIGKTICPLVKRLQCHVRGAQKTGKTYKDNWIRSMLRKGLVPIIQHLKTVFDNGNTSEILFIKHFRDEGFSLTNTTDGGDGPSSFRLSKEAIEKSRKARIGFRHSKETRLKMSQVKIGSVISLETREKMSRVRKEKMQKYGFLISKQTREKLREIGKKRIVTEETRAKHRQLRHTEETKHQISQAHIGMGHTEETKQKLREAAKKQFESIEMRFRCGRKRGHITSEVTRKIRSENAKRLWRDPCYRERRKCKE